ncbi:MAG TPA: hypothetical protein VKK79_21245 [Candidatus Lokiarchaeia archaeon]|nr:hypothetical protein [Candidatus Lokiarchaeia archaeon]
MGHPGALVYAVGNITERTKDGRVYLNLRPRGWVRVEIEIVDAVVPKRGRSRRQ